VIRCLPSAWPASPDSGRGGADHLGLTLVPGHWIWLLGLLPLSLGISKLVIAIRAHRSGEQASAVAAKGLPGVIGITIANGGDNLAAYTPVFATISRGAVAVTIAVFAAGVAIWCLAGFWLVSHHKVTQAIRGWGHWIIPAVYILIGLYIFEKTGALSRVLRPLAWHTRPAECVRTDGLNTRAARRRAVARGRAPQAGAEVEALAREGALAGRWLLDPQASRAEFRVRHFWNTITVRGWFERLEGEGTVGPDGTVTGQLVIDPASLTTKNKQRDRHLRSADFFDVQQHPRVIVTVSRGGKGRVARVHDWRMPLFAFEGHAPAVSPAAWIAPTATLVGDVRVEAEASIWYGAVLRADFGAIIVRRGANVQDGSVLHGGSDPVTEVGEGATIGHLCVVHGAVIGAEALVGNGATVLDGAVVGRRALVAAGCTVPPGMSIPDGMLAVGVPARIAGEVTARARQWVETNPQVYRDLARRHAAGVRPVARPGHR